MTFSSVTVEMFPHAVVTPEHKLVPSMLTLDYWYAVCFAHNLTSLFSAVICWRIPIVAGAAPIAPLARSAGRRGLLVLAVIFVVINFL